MVRLLWGFTYRLTQVRFISLEALGAGPLPLADMLRHEAMFFYRVQLGRSPVPRWHFQTTMGVSISGESRVDNSQSPLVSHTNRNLQAAFLASVGMVYTLPIKRRD